MHLIQAYSLASSSKIDRPRIIEKFFPLAVDNYITFHPFSKYDSKNYGWWQDVADYIFPILSRKGLSIVQIGTNQDKRIMGCYDAVGQTSIGQAAYLVARAQLHLGADSFLTHVASGFGKKIVALYSNNYAQVVRPYWTKPEDMFLLEPDRTHTKPSFAAQENPKTINEIKPEVIAERVLQLLGFPLEWQPHSTVFIGSDYHSRILESVPNQILDNNQFGIDGFIVRMDYLFNEQMLVEQLKRCPCAIVTDRPIQKEILKVFLKRIKEIVYIVNSKSSTDFAAESQSLNINTYVVSSAGGDELAKIKYNFLDHGAINIKHRFEPELVNKIKTASSSLGFKTAKFTLSDGKIFPSKEHYLKGKSIPNFNHDVLPIEDTEEFWREINYFRILSTDNSNTVNVNS